MPRLELALLGGFRARVEPGAAIALPTRKSQALLAYLSMPPGQAHPRDKLAALQIVDGRVDTATLAADSLHAETVLVLDYYRLPSTTIRHVTVRQAWEYRADPGGWFIVTPLPSFP